MSRQPTLASLRLFLELADRRSFTDVGRTANVSQPALSRTIRLLEEQLGTRLFDRNSRNVTLTQAGEALLPIVERLTADFDHAFSELAHTFAGDRGRVVVGALPSVAAGVLPAAIAGFQASHPHVDIALRDQLSGALYQQMQDRQVDFAITTPPESDGFIFEPLVQDPVVLVVRAGSALDVPRPASWSLLTEHTFIAMAPRSSVRELTDAAFAAAGITVRGRFECTQLATLGALIEAGLGITALPESTLGLLHTDQIRSRPLESPRVERTIGLARACGRTLSPAAEAFWTHYLRCCRHPAPKTSIGGINKENA